MEELRAEQSVVLCGRVEGVVEWSVVECWLAVRAWLVAAIVVERASLLSEAPLQARAQSRDECAPVIPHITLVTSELHT